MEQNASSTVTYYTPIGITVKTALCSHPLDTQGGEKVKGESFRAGGAEGNGRVRFNVCLQRRWRGGSRAHVGARRVFEARDCPGLTACGRDSRVCFWPPQRAER